MKTHRHIHQVHPSVPNDQLVNTILQDHRSEVIGRLGFWPGYVHGGTEITHRNTTVLAYVNEDRWVASCPNCNSGMACTPGIEAVCLDCGSIYSVEFPSQKQIEQAEKILEVRPVRNRNWFPEIEKIADLKKENKEKGLD